MRCSGCRPKVFETERMPDGPGPTSAAGLPDAPSVELIRLRRLFARLPPAAAALAAGTLVAGAFAVDLTISAAFLAIVLGLLSFWEFGTRLLATMTRVLDERAALLAALGSMREKEQHFRGLAYHDELTGLPNQRLFDDRLSLAIAHCSREKSRLAVLYLDLDGFKAVNDSFGHGLGDRMLVELADRIRSGVRAEDTVARLGGDEFAVLLPQVTGAVDAGRVVTKILDALRVPFRFDCSEVAINASVGVSLFPEDGASPGDLIRSADAAMYRAKQHRPELEPA